MSDALVLQEIRPLRESFESRFLAHEEAISRRFDRFEDSINQSLSAGGDRMKEHSDRIRAIETESDTHPALPPVTALTAPESKTALPWWFVAGITGIVTFLGPKLFTVAIDWLSKLNHIASTP